MPTLDELQATGNLHDALAAGIADISQQTTVDFTVYQKVVLPLDGFVFWLRSYSFEQAGAIHFMVERAQEETETVARNTVVFTTQEQVQDLNTEDTQTLVIGNIDSRQYAFGRHGWFFPQAGVWHYQGTGINAAVQTQLVDDPSQIDTTSLIVSDSLPAWLSLVAYDPVWISWPVERNPHITLYPSYLVPDNLIPPYGVVHIEPGRIEALQSTAMWTTPTYSHYQLTRESVRVTLYGANNDQAADFLDLVEQYTLDTDAFGILNMPTLHDGKRIWNEGMVLAQQKFIDFEVSYVQTRINNVARQLITEAIARVLPDPLARTAGMGDPDAQAQASIQTGQLFIVASLGAQLDAGGDVQGDTLATLSQIQVFEGAADVRASADIVAVTAFQTDANADLSGNIFVLGPSNAAQTDAEAGISGTISVLVPLAGQIDVVAE